MTTILISLALAISIAPDKVDIESGKKAYKSGDYELALDIFGKLAKTGDADAQHRLGDMYFNGKGVPLDIVQAVTWYTRAAKQGSVTAQANLGAIYSSSARVFDLDKAISWYEMAAGNGDMESRVALGSLLCMKPKSRERGIRLLEQAAEQGSMNAVANLAKLYFDGKVVPRDYVRAEKWVRRLAGSGSSSAQNRLGAMYSKGWGLEQDANKAIEWFEKASETGSFTAPFNLGLLYFNRNATPEDVQLAWRWFRIAADRGNRDALLYIGNMYAEGRGADKDDVQAWVYYNLGRLESIRNEKLEAVIKSVEKDLTTEQLKRARQLLEQERNKIREKNLKELGLVACYPKPDPGVMRVPAAR